jgi:hypothetical protein
MAFLDSDAPDVFGPESQVEEEPYVWGLLRRTNSTVRVVWAIDASGGESPPSTHTIGANTYNLLSTSVDRGYGQPLGQYTAIYRKEGTWAPVV